MNRTVNLRTRVRRIDGTAAPDLSDLELRLERALSGLARQLGRRPETLRVLLSVPRARALLRDMEERIGPLAGKSVLEIGSGCGLVLTLANAEFGADGWGVDPAQAGYDGLIAVAQEVLGRYGVDPARLLCATGEALPVAGGQFDVVCSFYALEHVRDLEGVVREAARVLRPGGRLYFVAPNYGSIWEGHYGIPWIPRLPRRAASLYVRLLGRSAEPLHHINFTSVSRIMDAVARTGALRLESLGLQEFERRLRQASVAELDTARWSGPMLRLLGVPGLITLVVLAASWLKLWTPLVVVARRAQ